MSSRIAGWVFVACCLLGIVGLFTPAIKLDGAPGFVAKYTGVSLYTASTKTELTKKIFAAYHRAPGKGLGHAVAKALIPRTGKRLGGLLDDIKGAAETIDEVSDEDIGLAGKALVATVWILLVLNVLAGATVFAEAMSSRAPRMKRLVIGTLAALVIAALAVAIQLVAREVVWTANDELGKPLFTLGVGAWLILVGGVGAFASGLGFIIARRAGSSA